MKIFIDSFYKFSENRFNNNNMGNIMLPADFHDFSLTAIAKQESRFITKINIFNLLMNRKYLILHIDEPEFKPVHLTSRQLQCLILMVKGYSDDLAADTLKISRHTFYEHMRVVSKKFGIRSRDILIQCALNAKIWL